MIHAKSAAAATTLTTDPHTGSVVQNLAENVVYLMGFSFIMGSLFTVLMLVILDVIRRRNLPGT